MLTDMLAGQAWTSRRDTPHEHEVLQNTQAFYRERKWRQSAHRVGTPTENIAISRWTDEQNATRQAEATTPPDRYFIGICLKITRLKLTRGRQTIFDGIMPAGTLYVSAPSNQLNAQFHTPCDFLHFHASTSYFPSQFPAADGLNDLILLRYPFAEQLAKALTEHGNTTDEQFARCIGQTLAMHLARLESPRSKVKALPKWRLRRVEEYVKARFDSCISLSDMAKVAGLSRMHFAAQFRAATGFRPREYLLHQRIEHAKSLLLNTGMPLVEVALAVGFCTQAHFSTVFKRLARETPARWRCASRNELPAIRALPQGTSVGSEPAVTRPCEMRNSMGSRNTSAARSAMLQV